MKRVWGVLLGFALLYSNASAAQEWKYIVAGEGPRILYWLRENPNDSFPVYIYCDLRTKQFVAEATLGVLPRPPGGGSFSIGIAGERPVVLSGKVGAMPYNDEYLMTAVFPRQHPLFDVLMKKKPMVYSAGAIRSFPLSTTGLASALNQLFAACR